MNYDHSLLSDEDLKLSSLFADRLAVETERWCRKALAAGTGNRLWRSDVVAEPWPSTVVTYKFAILRPGEMLPGSGMVFGPFSDADPSNKSVK